MADRKASVTLELKASQFKAEAAAAEKSVDGLDRKVEELDRDINKIPADSAKAAAGLGVLDEAAKKTARDVDDLGRRARETGDRTRTSGDEVGKFKSRIEELEGSLTKLASEFDRTGDPALLKKFRADSSELAGLKKMRKEVSGFSDEVKKLTENMSMFSFETPGFGQAAVAGVGLLGVPALATAGGAALGVVGAAGAGAGVASAVMGDPGKFQAEWTAAAGVVQKEFLDIGLAFTGPTLAAIKTIGPTVASWHLSEALAPAAKFVPILVDGLERAATGLEHGIADGIAKAEPDVQALSQGLAQLGTATGDALSHIADGAEGGAQALHDTISAVSAVVEGFGLLTEGAEKAYSAINDHPFIAAGFTAGLSIPASLMAKALGDVDQSGKSLGQTLPGVKTAIDETGHSVSTTASDLAELQKELNAAAATTDAFVGKQVSGALNSMLSLDEATLHWHQTLTQLAPSITKGKEALNENTAAGQKNISAIYGAVQANVSLYQAQISSGITAEDAAKAYDVNTAALERQLRKAGLTQVQIDGLIGKYRGVPTRVDTNIAVEGLSRAINDLDDLIRTLNHIPARKDVTIYTHTGTVGGKEGPAFYAEGGDPPEGWAWTGEKGPELVHFSGNEHVYTAAQSRRIANGTTYGSFAPAAATSSAPGAMAVTFAAAPGADTGVGSFLNSLIRNGLVVVRASQVRAG